MSDDVVKFWSTPWLYMLPFEIDEDGTVLTHCVDYTNEYHGVVDYGWEPVQHGPLPVPDPLPDFVF